MNGESDNRLRQELEAALGDDFEILRPLGRGSMASVYLAREKSLGRLVAVKVLLPGRASDETARRRFEREARAAASLVHPNVVQVYRFGRLHDGTPFLVMRFVRGRTMEERLKAEGRLPRAVARQVLEDVAAALAAAHARGIVHRDVRPANILWDEESETAHLADFGIAGLLATGSDETTRLTRTGQMIGDPKYLSPEQLLDRDLTALSDMYAFGVLGYELYTGRGPYEARTNTQWISAHLSADPIDLVATGADIEPHVADLLRRCLDREPNHRPTPAHAARILAGEVPTRAPGALPAAAGEVSDLQQLIRRRVPQVVLLVAGAGYGLMEVTSQLAENGMAPGFAYPLTVTFVVSAIAAASVVAWFHGEKGKQRTRPVEVALLGLIAAIWIAVSVLVVATG